MSAALAFVLHGRCTFQSPDIMRFLGHRVPVTTGRVDARFQGDVRTQVGTPLGQAAAPLCQPLTHDGHRYRALQSFGTDAALVAAQEASTEKLTLAMAA